VQVSPEGKIEKFEYLSSSDPAVKSFSPDELAKEVVLEQQQGVKAVLISRKIDTMQVKANSSSDLSAMVSAGPINL